MYPGAIILLIAALSLGGDADLRDGAPPVVLVQQQAIAHARLEPQEISTWRKRARMAAYLPKLQVEYQRRVRDFVNVDVNSNVYVGSNGVTVGPDDNAYTQDYHCDNNIGVKAIWSLGDVVFNQNMLRVSTEARHLARQRQSLLAEVNENYYGRKRLVGEIVLLREELQRAPRSNAVRRELFLKQVACREAGAALDALTGGWFSTQMKPSERGASVASNGCD